MIYGIQITEDETRGKVFVAQLECSADVPKDKRIYVRSKHGNALVIKRSDASFAEKLAQAVDQGLSGSIAPGMHAL